MEMRVSSNKWLGLERGWRRKNCPAVLDTGVDGRRSGKKGEERTEGQEIFPGGGI
jgi:hypothetical protein